jgi:hypothetical protein
MSLGGGFQDHRRWVKIGVLADREAGSDLQNTIPTAVAELRRTWQHPKEVQLIEDDLRLMMRAMQT